MVSLTTTAGGVANGGHRPGPPVTPAAPLTAVEVLQESEFRLSGAFMSVHKFALLRHGHSLGHFLGHRGGA